MPRGGPRPNSGGARPGAGRPKKVLPPITVPAGPSPLDFLLGVMNDAGADPALRVKAATTAAQYLHVRKQDGGKKDGQVEKAGEIARGKFGARPGPLKLVNGA